jgi:nanoRNase/pAp phosphatase (c-di-AMP/oligoRNAs hydrolase)
MGLTLPPAENVRKVAILCHRHADADTYLSAYALAFMIGKLMPGAETSIIIPDGMSSLTQRLALSFPHEKHEESQDYDLLVAVDIGHMELLKDWSEKLRKSRGVKILVDHHPIQEGTPYDQLVVDTTASSAAEIVYRLFKEAGVVPDAKASQALLIAILFDSQHLSIAGVRTLKAVVELTDLGASLDEARAILRSPPDYGEVIAKLKAARRSRIYRSSGWVILVSTVGSFQANVARAFTHLGADVSLVVGDFDGELRGSLRANSRFSSETKVHLGTDVAEVLSKGRGYGGGHPTAASFTCSASEEDVIKQFLVLIGGLLHEAPTEVK